MINTSILTDVKKFCEKTTQQIPKDRIALDLQVNDLARKVMASPLKQEQKDQALTELKKARLHLLRNEQVGSFNNLVHFNLVQPLIGSAPICPAFGNRRIPTFSDYHAIGSNIATVRLDPSAQQYVPAKVLEKVGNLEGKELDLFWTAIDGRPFVNAWRFLNLSTHCWSHPHALHGDDVICPVEMGIFPEIGFRKSDDVDAIAVNAISSLPVHIHSGEDAMLYSPDNAHFWLIQGTPFGILWSVVKKDQRVAITKTLAIFDYNHPISKALVHSVRECNHLPTHLQRLRGVEESIHKTFADLRTLFLKDPQRARNEFKKLPDAFRFGIFEEVWHLFGSPAGIHGNFGQAALENDSSLEAKYHCSKEECAHAIDRFAARLCDLLVNSQSDLFVKSQTLVKGDNVLKMMTCAQAFFNKEMHRANALFADLSTEQQEASRFAVWELSGCPRVGQFGNQAFANPHSLWKAEAVLLAASRQKHLFDQPISLGKEGKQEETLPARAPTTPVEISAAVMNKAYDMDFQALSNVERAVAINQLCSPLSSQLKAKIYGGIYENSTNPNKGGDSWGEKHVADDLDVMVATFSEVIN